MNKKQLEIHLSKLIPVAKPTLSLEQYPSPSDLAAELLWKAFLNGDIENKIVADFGCGNGILGCGALLLGAKKVYFVDIDERCLILSKKNSLNKGIYLCQDIQDFDMKVDTVLMNPPFGVQNRKADKPFLQKAMNQATSIYSIHKIESESFLKKITQENGFSIQELLKRTFVLKASYSFHTKKQHPVSVGIWILRKI